MIARRSLLRELVALCVVVGGLLFVWSAPVLGQREHEFSFSFGSEGTSDGQLMRPGALAVNEATGDVYVIDRENGRVEIFDASGVYVGQFNGDAAPAGAFSWPSFAPGSIAVDNSSNPLDPSKGDVYVLDTGHGEGVVEKFSASGVYLGEIADREAEPTGVAVDSSGALWVTNEIRSYVERFNDVAPVNEYVSSLKLHPPNEGTSELNVGDIGLALDLEGNVYIGLRHGFSGLTFSTVFSTTGEALIERLDDEETTGLAVDESSGDVYVDHGTSVAAYSPSHAAIERFGSGEVEASEGIAVDAKTGTVYTANAGSQQIEAFTAFVVPDAVTGSVSNLAETSVTVGGVVDPDGLPVTSCVFEYGPSSAYGQSEQCSPSPGSGSGPVAVSAQLSDLAPLTKYHYRVGVSNANGSNRGQDRTFVTPKPVALAEESVSDVSSTSALFGVQVNPGGAEAVYHFEYGPSEAYGESVPIPAGDLGSGTFSTPVSVRVEGLLEQATYHVRVVASNPLGTVYGPDQRFTTQVGGGEFVLPDGREWELVSPPNKEGALILPIGGADNGHWPLIEASPDGSTISYAASSPVGTGPIGNSDPFGLTQVLSRRGGGGWSSQDIASPHQGPEEDANSEFLFFSSDLSRALVEPLGVALLSPEATEETPYVRDDGSGGYTPLVDAGDVIPGAKFGPPYSSSGEDPHAVAVTPDLSHALFLSPYALTNNAVQGRGSNLYEWSGGRLQLVNVLPDGTASQGETELGGGIVAGHDTRNAFSSDGSRVFFNVGAGLALYMRDMVTGKTLQVPPPPASAVGNQETRFQIASADGSKVFYLGQGFGEGDLYVCQIVEEAGELKCDVTDLSVDPNAGETASVQPEVVGAAEDGSIVYFVAQGKLAEGAEPGKENLYVESERGSAWSAPRLVAILSEADNFDWAGRDAGAMSHLTSRVSPSGRYLTFMSEESLTGYDNRDALSGQSDMEVFLYDEATGQLRCVSCNPTGARPEGVFDPPGGSELLVDPLHLWVEGRWLAGGIPGWTEPEEQEGYSASYQSRVLSDEGRMFFDSADSLVAQATNGKEDVYEYEPVGVGGSNGCMTALPTYVASAGGCVSLVSSGTSSEESVFLDASEGGGDVFFLTAARLASQDVDTAFDVYDAHVCSAGSPCVSAPVLPAPCTSGDACKAAPSLQPAIFGAPASATFAGSGNITAATSEAVKAKPKSKPVKCRKNSVRRDGRCVRSRVGRKKTKARKAGEKRGARS